MLTTLIKEMAIHLSLIYWVSVWWWRWTSIISIIRLSFYFYFYFFFIASEKYPPSIYENKNIIFFPPHQTGNCLWWNKMVKKKKIFKWIQTFFLSINKLKRESERVPRWTSSMVHYYYYYYHYRMMMIAIQWKYVM